MSGLPKDGGRKWIRPLPERLINKIAAGEVVERPASVVKELVENSLDAGAKRVDVFVEKSGARLIKIIDDGCGIPPDQIEIAFSRHATSKISEFKDLDSIASYGFRGEALPSIASVSRLRMVSRTHQDDAGIEIIYEGGVLQSRRPIPAPPGTTIEVENLFFNTPARRKFLKAETTELRHISRTVTALAIGRYDVGISYTVNERRLFTEPSGQPLKERVTSLLAPGKAMVAVNGHTGPVTVEGYVGAPDQVQSNRSGQYLFVNGRAIQSPTLSHAFMAGYGEMLPRGNFPLGALLLTVDPAEVDVNVHPAKTEVRLSHEREIHDALQRLIRESLRRAGLVPSLPVSRPSAEQDSLSDPSAGASPDSASVSNRIPGVTDLASTNPEFLSRLYRPPTRAGDAPPVVKVDTRTGEIVEPEEAAPSHPSSSLHLVGRFSDLYLIVQHGNELLIVDQHTAHERVLFEQTMRQIEKQEVVAQQLLFPIQVEFSPVQAALFEEARSVLEASGFSIEPFGGRTVKIEAVPSVLSRKSPERSLLAILDDVGSMRKTGHDLKKSIAQSIACRSAVMAGDHLGDREALALVEALFTCHNIQSCPHGRPTFIKMTRADLDRQFGRG